MPIPIFSVSIADLKQSEREIDCEIPVEWLSQALAGTEASPAAKPGRLRVRVSKNGRQVLVRGQVQATVVMPCSRTLEPVPVEIDTPIYLLLSPRRSAAAAPDELPPSGRKPQTKGKRPEKLVADSLSDDDAAGDSYEGDQIALDEFVREHLLLEFPMFPVRSDLRSESATAIRAPSAEADSPRGSSDEDQAWGLDPRLAPLARLAEQLKKEVKG